MERETTSWHFRCLACGRTDDPTRALWRCPNCGGELTVEGLPNELSPTNLAGLWKWSDALPVRPPEHGTLLGETVTPLVPVDIDGMMVHLKLDSLLPTGSFKDRGAAVLALYLRTIGVERIIVDSSGNAAASMSAYAAATGLDCTVYVPASASAGKLVQARAYGATVIPVEGSRDDVATAAQAAAENDHTASYASHNWHPVFVEGVKTWALDVREQLGGRNPDAMFIPTGGGSAFVGAWRALSVFDDPLPQLIACQPGACAPIVSAWEQSASISPVDQGDTIAEGTRIAMPSRPRQIEQALEESGGRGTAVDEDLLKDTLRLLWSRGFYVEPTGALGVAACRIAIAEGRMNASDTIVAHITGHGLKASQAVEQLLNESGYPGLFTGL